MREILDTTKAREILRTVAENLLLLRATRGQITK